MQRAFLFTGQGSQFPGMGTDLVRVFPAAVETFAEADAVLGENLAELCFNGSVEDLGLTTNTQPATLTVSVAAFRALGQIPDCAAGHSLGEYSALVAAGTFEFADAVRLVRLRAEKMQAAVPVGVGGMVVLRKMNEVAVRELIAGVDGVCEIANVNSPGQIVVSGEKAAMAQVIELAGPRKSLELPVSVPFHCSLLREAGEEFATALDEVEMRDPKFPVWCNVDAVPVTTAAAARDALKRQFAGGVLWQQTIEGMLDEGIRDFTECGPKAVLTKMVLQIANARDVEGVKTHAATDPEEIADLLST